MRFTTWVSAFAMAGVAFTAASRPAAAAAGDNCVKVLGYEWSGEKQSMDIYVFAQSACETCKNAGLTIEVQGDHHVVTSLSLPGFRVNFSSRGTLVDAKAQADTATPYSEQIDVSVSSK